VTPREVEVISCYPVVAEPEIQPVEVGEARLSSEEVWALFRFGPCLNLAQAAKGAGRGQGTTVSTGIRFVVRVRARVLVRVLVCRHLRIGLILYRRCVCVGVGGRARRLAHMVKAEVRFGV
jgi:hypothetical protein